MITLTSYSGEGISSARPSPWLPKSSLISLLINSEAPLPRPRLRPRPAIFMLLFTNNFILLVRSLILRQVGKVIYAQTKITTFSKPETRCKIPPRLETEKLLLFIRDGSLSQIWQHCRFILAV